MTVSASQKSALLWLKNRGGDGVFQKNNLLCAAGEIAPVMRTTWRKLQSASLMESHAPRRVRLTRQGNAFNLAGIEESQAAGFVQEEIEF